MANIPSHIRVQSDLIKIQRARRFSTPWLVSVGVAIGLWGGVVAMVAAHAG